MPVKIGLLGYGFMGAMHATQYQAIRGARLSALCDIDRGKLSGKKKVQGNIEGNTAVDVKKLKTTTDAAELFADSELDAIDICLPTDLHAEYAIAALKAGKDVICEKPLARDAKQAAAIVAAAKKARRKLYVAQCIRFWPAFAKLAEILKKKTYGALLSARFQRLSATPTWSWNNWLMDAKRSGGAALDLHIHDADFVLSAFGKPRAVFARTAPGPSSKQDYIHCQYVYPGNRSVTVEGGWNLPPAFGFTMNFCAIFEKGTLVFPDEKGGLSLLPNKGKARSIKLPAKDGYRLELEHFVDCLAKGRKSDRVDPDSARKSVRLVELELQSARTGKPVPVKF